MSFDETEPAFAPGFTAGMSREAIVQILGEPEDIGQGAAQSCILAYRNRSIQLFLHRDQLNLLACYYRNRSEDAPWPPSLHVFADFTQDTSPAEVRQWLELRGLSGRHEQNSGSEEDEVIRAPSGIGFHFQSGRLDSIQMTWRSGRPRN